MALDYQATASTIPKRDEYSLDIISLDICMAEEDDPVVADLTTQDMPTLDVEVELDESVRPASPRRKASWDDDAKSVDSEGSRRSVSFNLSDELDIPDLSQSGSFGRSVTPPKPPTPSDRPRKSALKVKRSESGLTEAKVRNIEKQVGQTLESFRLRGALTVRKINRRSGVQKRLFRVSEDGTDLMWKGRASLQWRRLPLASVSSVFIGPRAKSFGDYNYAEGKPWLCMSFVSSERSLHLEFESREDYRLVVLGSLYLLPLSKKNPTRAMVMWYMALFKTVRIALSAGIPVRKVWELLVGRTRHALDRGPPPPSGGVIVTKVNEKLAEVLAFP